MDFKLPDIGEGVHEGEVTKWLVKKGELLKPDQPMVEVMTDKATVEIPAPVGGVVEELCANEGQTIEVGKVLLRIKEAGAKAEIPSVPLAERVKKESLTQVPQEPPPRSPVGEVTIPKAQEVIPFTVLATPATRQLARNLNLDIRTVTGTGPQGRITKLDVQMASEMQQAGTRRSTHPSPGPGLPAVASLQVSLSQVAPARGTLQVIPLRGVRKKISEAMSHSKRTAAHFTYVEEVDMSEIVRLRTQAMEEAKRRGVKLTFLPFIIKAVIPALIEFPFLNASLDDEKQEIVLKGDYNIGIATDTANGLMVPVIKGADRKTIWELASDISTLSGKARSGKIAVEDMRGGSFTLTNAGSIGGVFATPVINHPEVAILGVNSIRKRPVVKEDQIIIRDMMFLSLSVDHRVVDGADAARFMNRLIYFLSDPTRLVFA